MEQSTVFQFEDVIQLDDRAIQKVLKEIKREFLIAALKDVDSEVKEKFYRNMSPRNAAWLKCQDRIYSYRVNAREEARQKIIAIVQRLKDTGEIVVARASENTSADDAAAEGRIASLIEEIEQAIEKTGHLSLPWENPASITKALAAFEGRADELRRIRELDLDMTELEAAQPLFRAGELERLCIYNSWKGFIHSEAPTLPESLRACSGLKYLTVLEFIQTLPEWIGGFASLTELSLNGTKSTALPQGMRNLASLEYLNLDNTDIKELPEWIGGFASLTQLYLSGTKITALPQGMRNLASLERLDLDNTDIKELPEWIGGFASLTKLSLSGTKITALPQSMRNLAALKHLDLDNTDIKELPEWLAELACLKTIDIHRTAIEDIPAAFTGKGNPEDSIAILREIEFMPDHELNFDEFVSCYYYIVYKSLECLEKARREGLLALEEDVEDFGDRDLFKTGLRLVVDGYDASRIREILPNLIEREHDPYKRRLKQIQTEAILSIQSIWKSGECPVHLLMRLGLMVDIPDNKVRAVCAAYYQDASCSLDDALNKVFGEKMYELYAKPCLLPPAEREEVRFMVRAVSLAKKAYHEGLLALESDWDRALFARWDIFEYGIVMAIDGEEAEFIKNILDALIEYEGDPWKRKLMTLKRDAVLSIQAGDHPRFLAMKMLTRFDQSIGAMVEAELLKE